MKGELQPHYTGSAQLLRAELEELKRVTENPQSLPSPTGETHKKAAEVHQWLQTTFPGQRVLYALFKIAQERQNQRTPFPIGVVISHEATKNPQEDVEERIIALIGSYPEGRYEFTPTTLEGKKFQSIAKRLLGALEETSKQNPDNVILDEIQIRDSVRRIRVALFSQGPSESPIMAIEV